MALGGTLDAVSNFNGVLAFPVSMSADWATLVDAAGPATADNANIRNPTTQITAATRHIFRRQNRSGTILVLRLAYDDGITLTTSPVVRVFGRSSGQAWESLKNKGASKTATLTVDATNDDTDGTLNYTLINAADHWFDCQGCDELLVGVQTAFAVSAGTTANSFIQGKII